MPDPFDTGIPEMLSEEDCFGPGSFGCHEAMHMANVIAEMVNRELIEHPAIKRNRRWLTLAERAEGALTDLYTAIGEKHL